MTLRNKPRPHQFGRGCVLWRCAAPATSGYGGIALGSAAARGQNRSVRDSGRRLPSALPVAEIKVEWTAGPDRRPRPAAAVFSAVTGCRFFSNRSRT